MKNDFVYEPFNQFVLRTPFYPFKKIKGINENDIRFKELIKAKEFREALFVASPTLFEESKKFLDSTSSLKKKAFEGFSYSLLKYYCRMSTRQTPFGLFAGCSVGTIGKETSIKLSNSGNYKRHTRLDMNYLCALAQDLGKHPKIKENIKFYPNKSLYKTGFKLRYVEYKYTKDSEREHHIVEIEDNEYIRAILKKAFDGAFINDLSYALVDKDVSFEESKEFVNELIDSQVLTSELEPSITGLEFLDQILNVITPIEGINNIVGNLLDIKEILLKLDNQKIGTSVNFYYDITKKIDSLGTGYQLKYLFQTDTIKPTVNATLARSVIDDVQNGIRILNKLTPLKSESNLSRFRDAFLKRYESQEVPILKALDTESGIGYLRTNQDLGDINPLVDDLHLPTKTELTEIRWNDQKSYLFKKVNESLLNSFSEIEINENDLNDFANELNDLPDTISTMIQIIEKCNDGRDKIYINSAGGSSAANLIGRFCHADSNIFDFVKEIIQKEEENNPDKILAEIIHLPESRVGNILLRPILRNYEIPYLGKASVSRNQQLSLDDLYVSVDYNKIILRSKSLNKEVIPRLTAAHNYSAKGLPVYHFLCDLQHQSGRGSIGFSWGDLENEFSFLPRVAYKNLIFSFAKWNIKKNDIQHLIKLTDDNELADQIYIWCEKLKLPSEVLLVDGDNELYIDFNNLFMVKQFLQLVKNRDFFQLSEFLFEDKNTTVSSPEGNFTNQIVLAFYKSKVNNS